MPRFFRLSLLVLSAIAWIVAPVVTVTGMSPQDTNFLALYDLAEQHGSVHVIVRLGVPDLEVYRARSLSFQPGNRSTESLSIDADRQLKEAIAVSRSSILSGLENVRFTLNRTYDTLPYVALTIGAEALQRLVQLPAVLDITEDRAIPLEDPPVATAVSGSATENRSQYLVAANTAWDYGFSGAGWYVAVLDTGIRRTHEMFAGKDVVEACFARGPDPERVSPLGDCPNGQSSLIGPGSAQHYPDSYSYHGTHVAGIAVGNNFVDRFGVAKDADLIAVNVFSWFPQNQQCLSWSSDQLKGLEFVYQQRHIYRIAAVNLSLGSGANGDFCDKNVLKPAIDNLRAVGIATVISGGNDAYCGRISSPACVSSAVAVGGSDYDDNPYSSGNWDSRLIRLLAPGVSIQSAYGFGDRSYASMTGTSMAAPHVAGAWAILRQYDETLSVDRILQALQQSGVIVASDRCTDQGVLPRIHLATTSSHTSGALDVLRGIAPPIDPSFLRVNRAWPHGKFYDILTWKANPFNIEGLVTAYRIYSRNQSQRTFLAEVDASQHRYIHYRSSYRDATSYLITAIDGSQKESLPNVVQFNRQRIWN